MWPSLAERDTAATVYQDPDWLLAWARHLPASCEPLIVAAVAGRRPAAALALVREADRTGRTRITPLSWPACEQVRPVGESKEAVSVLVRRLPHLADDVLIADVAAGSVLDRQASSRWGRPHTQTLYATLALPLDLTSLSRSTRRDHTCRRRAIEALGDRVGYHRTRTTPELLAACDVLQALFRRRNAPRAPAAGTADLALPWRQVLAHCAPTAFIATLTLDTHPVAAQLCLRRGDRVHSVITAMDPAHGGLAPGHALLHRLCEDLTDEGRTLLDLGRTTAADGQRAYKAAYGALWTTTHTYTAPPNDRPLARQPAAAAHLQTVALR
ncbi:GNAT family N-acetyltransferase [Streptomyces sp. Ru62]|uniref:GNAT family N-acetyltransferase n=1 Tax=Streptomyces sp. Ru62 TaxID=2080745 RepID=UPI0015E28C18|nr:GNAT family N-acetyltransferase [Streptomyces sp. Ru62]